MDTKDKLLLDDRYSIISDDKGGFKSLPDYISLNLKHELRPYQEEAIGRYLHYYDKDVKRDKSQPVQLLFNMATGSGKTMIMAAELLDLYRRGYNKIIFFVHTTNIVEKTRENFLETRSNKYLFADKIIIDGETVTIREVYDFSDARKDSINIIFTTMAGLHSTLKNPRENGVTYEDLMGHDIVLIGDEAHHYSGDTKGLTKEEKENDTTWESTIATIMQNNNKNILLEFTATIDLEDANIFYKYKNRILYRYDLKAFREDGFSKDVWIHEVAAETMDRAIQAMIISQFRKKVALSHGVWLKPVVMFKSKLIAESVQFYDEYILKMKVLSATDIKKQKNNAKDILKLAFDYFDAHGISMTDLADELRYDFSEERTVSLPKNSITPELQRQLNTLEDKDNEIRAVFAVDVLNEGWDVLNLFDIVRLYDTRDARNGKVGKTTNAEAQLIGRGARYFPFLVDGAEPKMKYKRKFDENELQPLRVIEQLHYHSKSNTKYIQEIRQTLREKGIIADEGVVKRKLNLKKDFLETTTYKEGHVWLNEAVEKPPIPVKQGTLFGGEGYNLNRVFEVELPSNITKDTQVFGDTNEKVAAETKYVFTIKFGSLPINIVRHAADINKKMRYDTVAKKLDGLASLEAFLTEESQLGGIKVDILSYRAKKADALNAKEKLFIADKILEEVANDMSLTEVEYEGTRIFKPRPIKDVFAKEIERNYFIKSSGDSEFGLSQTSIINPTGTSTSYLLNLSSEDWHVYDDNFGTSEEKQLVLLIKKLIVDLRKKWTDIYLIRNDGAFKIFEFKKGRAFEPDYVLVANDNRDQGVSWQIFIEPKGGHLLETDKWKEDFLLSIANKSKVIAENRKIKVIGLPFYNNEKEKISHIIEDNIVEL